MNRPLRTKLPTSPVHFQPVVANARDQLVALQQQQKEVYERAAKPLTSLKQSDVVRVNNNGESQRAIVRDRANTPQSYIVETEEGSLLRRNRRHPRSTAEDAPTTAPHPLDESDAQSAAQPASSGHPACGAATATARPVYCRRHPLCPHQCPRRRPHRDDLHLCQ